MWTDNSAISYQLFDAIRRLTAGCVSKIADLQAYIALRYAAFKLVDLLFLMHGPVLPRSRLYNTCSQARSGAVALKHVVFQGYGGCVGGEFKDQT